MWKLKSSKVVDDTLRSILWLLRLPIRLPAFPSSPGDFTLERSPYLINQTWRKHQNQVSVRRCHIEANKKIDFIPVGIEARGNLISLSSSSSSTFQPKKVDKIKGHRAIVVIKKVCADNLEGNEFVDCATFFMALDSSFLLQRKKKLNKRAWNKKKSTWNYEWKAKPSRRRINKAANSTLTCSRMMANRLRYKRWRLQKT